MSDLTWLKPKAHANFRNMLAMKILFNNVGTTPEEVNYHGKVETVLKDKSVIHKLLQLRVNNYNW